MTKKIIALLLATLMLCALVACGEKEDGVTDDPVINLGVQYLTYTNENGDIFTYDYTSSTTVAITAFSGSDEPHTVNIPAVIDDYTVTSIAAEAFFSYSNISEVILPEGLLTVDDYAFAGCVALASVTFPSTMKDHNGAPAIGEGAFYGCTALASVDLSKTSAVTVDSNAFAGCTALTEIKFPTTLKTIGEYAFGACSALTAITLPEGVATVGAQAFYDCTSVASLTLPASLTEIGDWAFNPVARTLEDAAISVPKGSHAESYLKELR